MNFEKIMQKKDLIEEFEEQYKAKNMPIFLYGKGSGLKEYINLFKRNSLPIECIIDGLKKDRTFETYMGVQVKEPWQIYEEYMNGYIVVSAPRHRKAIVEDIIKSTKDRFSIICFDATLNLVQGESGEVRKAYYLRNKGRIENLYAILADNKSRECLKYILEGSVSNNCDCYTTIASSSQYFPDFIKAKMGMQETFVDLGAYTGDSVDDFLNAVNGKYNKIYAFEPDKINFQILKEKCSSMKINCMQYGIGNKNQKLPFYHGNEGVDICAKVVKIETESNAQIEVVRLDDIIDEKITYVKMDIEGMELEALEGGKKLLKKYRPKIAVSIYHKKEDLIDIPQFILNLNLGYKLFLRHYWEWSGTDSILYAIPDEESTLSNI